MSKFLIYEKFLLLDFARSYHLSNNLSTKKLVYRKSNLQKISTKNFYPPDHPYKKDLLKAGLQKIRLQERNQNYCKNTSANIIKTNSIVNT